jgi:phosphoribosylaminoimidazole (AIR) synthetase
MGIGMVVFVDPQGLREVLAALRERGQSTHLIGTVQAGGEGVVYDFGMVDGG